MIITRAVPTQQTAGTGASPQRKIGTGLCRGLGRRSGTPGTAHQWQLLSV